MNYRTVKSDELGESFVTFRHKSGLPVCVIPKERTHTFALLGVRFGSADRMFRVKGETETTVLPDGVAHFLEHKMFEDENGGDAFERFAQTGAEANAFTSAEETVYLFSATEKEEENLRILLDFVTHPYFTEETVAKEQGIIGEEIDMTNDEPGEIAYYNLLRALFAEHPVRREIVGTRKSIAEITPELLYRCTDLFYRPSNMMLVVCGKLTPETVERVCDEVLPEETEHIEIERLFPEEPETVCKPCVRAKAEIARPIAEIACKAIPRKAEEEKLKTWAANEITANLLFGRSGELFNRLYEKGLIDDRFDGAFVQSFRLNYAYWLVSAANDDPERIKDEVLAEVERRKERFFTREEFETARRVVYTDKLISFDSVESTAFAALSHWDSEHDFLRDPGLLAGITYEEAYEIFKSTFRTDRVVMSVVSPNENTRKEE